MDNKSGKDLAAALGSFCNGIRKEEVQEFVTHVVHGEHRTIQQNIMKVLVALIEEWAKCADNGAFDLRNEATVKLCKKIVDATGDKYDRILPYI